MKTICLLCVCMTLAACQTPGEVANQVMVDFGLRDKPEDYVSGADRVMENMEGVGRAEMRRLNAAQRHGGVEFQGEGLQGKYYKTAKRYEQFYALDAQPAVRSADATRGYIGYIEYSYRVYESPRSNTHAEAAAATANIPTDATGREVYRYRFTGAGVWDGSPGESVRRR